MFETLYAEFGTSVNVFLEQSSSTSLEFINGSNTSRIRNRIAPPHKRLIPVGWIMGSFVSVYINLNKLPQIIFESNHISLSWIYLAQYSLNVEQLKNMIFVQSYSQKYWPSDFHFVNVIDSKIPNCFIFRISWIHLSENKDCCPYVCDFCRITW